MKVLQTQRTYNTSPLPNLVKHENKVNHATINTGDGNPNPSVIFGQATAPGLNTLDFSDIKLLDAPSNKGGNTGSRVVLHETLEAYYTSQPDYSTNALLAHNEVGKIFPGYDFVLNSIQYGATDANGNVSGFTFDAFEQNNLNAKSVLTFKFVTPVPRTALPTESSARLGNMPSFNLSEVKKIP